MSEIFTTEEVKDRIADLITRCIDGDITHEACTEYLLALGTNWRWQKIEARLERLESQLILQNAESGL